MPTMRYVRDLRPPFEVYRENSEGKVTETRDRGETWVPNPFRDKGNSADLDWLILTGKGELLPGNPYAEAQPAPPSPAPKWRYFKDTIDFKDTVDKPLCWRWDEKKERAEFWNDRWITRSCVWSRSLHRGLCNKVGVNRM